jgi:choline dehydrogenase-like flavoprotein
LQGAGIVALNDEAFDYLIVGAGTAGCVLANRLSADPGLRVALIEAGPNDRHPFIHVPAAVAAAIATRSIGWGYSTAPQPQLGGRRIPIPRGRVLGGCSSINGMVYFRGQPKDFDDWAAAGNAGWSYREVLPYFTRSENNETWRNSPYHGMGGPINVIDIERPNPLNAAFLKAMASLQFVRTEDFNGSSPEGYGPRQATIRGGRRESGVTAYLRPIRSRPNLAVLTGALAKRVVIEEGKATGVELEIDGHPRHLQARREVVLAAGSIGSPQLLLLSGVGDGQALQALGISVKLNHPAVGKNLHDHLATSVQMVTKNADSYGISLKATPRGAWNILEYLLFRRGPLAGNVFEATAFLRTAGGLDRPDVQLVFQPARRNQSTFPFPIGHGFVLSVVLLYPKSRGAVSLASPDPHAAPIIDPNLLSEPKDFEPLLRGLRLARRIFACPAFARYRATEFLPGSGVQAEEALKDYIRRGSATVHHPAGTCRMGSDAQAVVDPELKVRGIRGLRVADASIFPRLVGGNTNAAVVMVAEKAADMMLGCPAPPPADLP